MKLSSRIRVAAPLLALAALAGCRSAGPRAVDTRLAAFLPEDTVVLAGMRLDEVRATPLGRHFAAYLATGGVEAHDVLASWDGSQWLVAVRGEGPGTVGDVTLTGHPDAVREAAARQRAGRAGPRALLARAPAGAQVWAVSNGAPMVPDLPGLGNAARLLNAMADIVAAVDLRDGVRVNVAATCRDDRNAALVGDAVRALAGVGRLQNAVTVEQRGPALNVTADIPKADSERLIDRFTRR